MLDLYYTKKIVILPVKAKKREVDVKNNKILLSAFFSLIVLFCLNSYVFAATQEELTISTYYPAPYGVYQKLRLYPSAAAPACDDNTKGLLYYDQTNNQMYVCKGTAESWQTAESFWNLGGTVLSPKDLTWAVKGKAFRTSSDPNYIHIEGAALGAMTRIVSVSTDATQPGMFIGATGGTAMPVIISSSKVELASGNGNWLTAYGNFVGTKYAELKAEGADADVSIILTPKGTGTVGLGTTTPQYPLEVAGKVKFYNPTPGKEGSFMMFDYSFGNSAAITLTDYRGKNWMWLGAYDDIFGNLLYTGDPSIGPTAGQGFGIAGGSWVAPFPRFIANANETFLGWSIFPGTGGAATGGDSPLGNLYVKGKVGIGTKTPAYELDVVGNINVSGLIKKSGTPYNFPDYVFEPKYNLIPIKDLKKFVNEKKHLPGMLSKDEINKKGVEIFEQNRLLTEKLEEAYLYIFQLEQRLDKLEKSVAAEKK